MRFPESMLRHTRPRVPSARSATADTPPVAPPPTPPARPVRFLLPESDTPACAAARSPASAPRARPQWNACRIRIDSRRTPPPLRTRMHRPTQALPRPPANRRAAPRRAKPTAAPDPAPRAGHPDWIADTPEPPGRSPLRQPRSRPLSPGRRCPRPHLRERPTIAPRCGSALPPGLMSVQGAQATTGRPATPPSSPARPSNAVPAGRDGDGRSTGGGKGPCRERRLRPAAKASRSHP